MSEDRTLCMVTGPVEAGMLVSTSVFPEVTAFGAKMARPVTFQDSSGHEELPPGCEDSKGRHFLRSAEGDRRSAAGCTGLCPAPKDESFFATGPRSFSKGQIQGRKSVHTLRIGGGKAGMPEARIEWSMART